MNIQRHRHVSSRRLSEEETIRYFFPKSAPPWTTIALFVGVILGVVGGILHNFAVVGLGMLVCVVGFVTIAMIAKSNPSDEQYDQWLVQQRQAIYFRGLRTLNLHQSHLLTESAPRVHSFVLPGSSAARDYRDEVHMKEGRDGRWRYSINVYTYFFLTEHYVAVFKSDVNAFNHSEHIQQRQHDTYGYHHIVGVTKDIFKDTVLVGNRELQYRIEQLCLKLTNGDIIHLSASVKATRLDRVQDAPTFFHSSTDIDRVLNRLRQLLLSQEGS